LTNKQLFLTNHDLKPVEPERRQWKHINFVTFWIADSFNINTWMIAASSLEVGLSWWQGMSSISNGFPSDILTNLQHGSVSGLATPSPLSLFA
jgi:nucleobase:cation symporter-1, NCS1 family